MKPNKQPPLPPAQQEPIVIPNGECEYRMLQPVGTWGPNNNLLVYEAIILPEHNINLPHVAFKMVPIYDGNNNDLADADVIKMRSFDALPDTILPIKKQFEAPLNNILHHCTVMLFDSEVTSLRSLMSSRPHLSTGIPQQCIAVALYKTLTALAEIHHAGVCHEQITAGNIYYHLNAKSIMLGFAASAYERTVIDQDQEGEAPVNSMLEWARPPEVQRGEGNFDLGWIYPHKNSDIWMIGITALELAYGRIRVTDRQELLRIAVYINKNRRLPNTWQQLRLIAAGGTIPEDSFTNFSESFGIFLGLCLHNDPAMRLSAELLGSNQHFFVRHRADMEYFENVVVNGLNAGRFVLHLRRSCNNIAPNAKPVLPAFTPNSDNCSQTPKIFHTDHGTYILHDRVIGKASGAQVHLTTFVPPHQEGPPIKVGLSVVRLENSDESRRQVRLNRSVNHILRVEGDFEAKGFYGVSYPYEDSLPLILLIPPRGFSEEFIRNSLTGILRGLTSIHRSNMTHGKISPATIYYDKKNDCARLAFGAALWQQSLPSDSAEELDVNKDEANFGRLLSSRNMYSWGRAPEVTKTGDQQIYLGLDKKADIWSVGILCLYLGFGRIPVNKREQILTIASEIWDIFEGRETVTNLSTGFGVDMSRFSIGFATAVANCLATQPRDRPSARRLQKFLLNN